jgi:hypothetical protein
MTVRELIALLSTHDPESDVVVSFRSEDGDEYLSTPSLSTMEVIRTELTLTNGEHIVMHEARVPYLNRTGVVSVVTVIQ